MENAKHLPLPLCFSLTKKANSSLKEEFALEITFSGTRGYNFREAKTGTALDLSEPCLTQLPPGGYCAKYALFAPRVPEYL